MKLAVDVRLDGDGAQAAAVTFDAWEAPEPTRTYTSRTTGVEPAVAGDRDQRKLNSVLQLLREHTLAPEVVVIDGLVHLDALGTPGWGAQLFDALGGRVVVIGISKTAPPGLPPQFEVYREESAAPVTVTCAGIDIGAAKARVRGMHGKRRVPTLQKRAARAAKGADAGP